MSIPLEDDFTDILTKVMAGLGVDSAMLAAQSGVYLEEIEKILQGDNNADALRKIAPLLGLNAAALVEAANKSWMPADPGPIPGLLCFNTPFDSMTVNSYLVWDPETKAGYAFDTGSDADDMLDAIEKHQIRLQALFLTHTHGDHILELDRLCEKTWVPAYVGSREPRLRGTTPFMAGRIWTVDSLDIETRLTWGHSEGGITYVVHGLEKTLAIVGDALFAGSMGGTQVSHKDALYTTKEEILSLADDVVVCPGHGPLTTIGEEKRYNPFFAQD